MQYALIFAEPQSEFDKRTDPEHAPAYWASWMAYIGAMREAGVLVGGEGLEAPSGAVTLRIRDGARDVQDGPFAETKELLGGFVVLEVESVEAALDWAARSPAATCGSVELRPCLPPPAQ